MQAILRKEAANLPPVAPPPKSSIGTNMLVFVAVLALLVVGIYIANKGKPPEATMFGGGAPAPAPTPRSTPGESAPAPSEGPGEAAPAEVGPSVSGVIRLADPDQAPANAVLFVTARPSAMGGKGPPLAVERVMRPSFPYTFELSAGDRMIEAMPWQGPIDVTARLDVDGNAMTKGAGDLTSGPGATNVALGRSDLELVLKLGE